MSDAIRILTEQESHLQRLMDKAVEAAHRGDVAAEANEPRQFAAAVAEYHDLMGQAITQLHLVVVTRSQAPDA